MYVHVAVVGSFACGKTSMLVRAAQISTMERAHDELPQVRSTVAMDFVRLNYPEHGVHLQVWDTAGQERFQNLKAVCQRRCSMILVVYDVGRRSSFEALPGLIAQARQQGQQPRIFVVANKLDLGDQGLRQVSMMEGSQLAFDHQAQYFETSARNTYQWTIAVLFKTLARAAADHRPPASPRDNTGIVWAGPIGKGEKKKPFSC